MDYIELDFTMVPLQPASEILIAELGAVGFESFTETETGVKAYIQADDWSPTLLEHIHVLNSGEFLIKFQQKTIEQVNWNAEWEKNFSPIVMNENCVVRAPFHEEFGREYEIVIEPKMSFGTGHHETTFMILNYLLEEALVEKSVLDMGCGTAVLAILAELRGAKPLVAIDIDPWCVENAEENIERNGCKQIEVLLGGADVIPQGDKYDVVIANINRNILLEDMGRYVAVLRDGGSLFLSGFYESDLSTIKACCKDLGLQYQSHKFKNQWVAVKFVL